MSSLLDFLKSQRRDLPILLTAESCAGATYIVTGSNHGIGLECAKHLVRMSAARVILAVRSSAKGEAARAEIDAATGRPGVAEVWILDMASYGSITAFAQRAGSELERIDAVIENAAVALDTWSVAEGLETSLTVNVVGTVLLAVLLLPKLRECAQRFGTKPCLTVVTSALGFTQRKTIESIEGDFLDSLSEEDMWPMTDRYADSKLLQIFAVRELASLFPPSRTGVTINMISPGLCNTGLARHARLSYRLQVRAANLVIGRTAEMGSRTLLHAAAAGEESHGRFLSDCEVKDQMLPPWVTDGKGRLLQKRVWEQVAKRLETIGPGCLDRAFEA